MLGRVSAIPSCRAPCSRRCSVKIPKIIFSSPDDLQTKGTGGQSSVSASPLPANYAAPDGRPAWGSSRVPPTFHQSSGQGTPFMANQSTQMPPNSPPVAGYISNNYSGVSQAKSPPFRNHPVAGYNPGALPSTGPIPTAISQGSHSGHIPKIILSPHGNMQAGPPVQQAQWGSRLQNAVTPASWTPAPVEKIPNHSAPRSGHNGYEYQQILGKSTPSSTRHVEVKNTLPSGLTFNTYSPIAAGVATGSQTQQSTKGLPPEAKYVMSKTTEQEEICRFFMKWAKKDHRQAALLCIRQLLQINDSTPLSTHHRYAAFCKAFAESAKYLDNAELAYSCCVLHKFGALHSAEFASALFSMALPLLPGLRQRSLCTLLEVLSDKNVPLTGLQRDQFHSATVNALKNMPFNLADGGVDFASVVKCLISPGALNDSHLLDRLKSLYTCHPDILLPSAAETLVRTLATSPSSSWSFSNDLLQCVLLQIGVMREKASWRQAVSAVHVMGLSLPAISETVRVLSRTEHGPALDLLKETKGELSLQDANIILLIVISHLGRVSTDDVLALRNFLSSSYTYTCLYTRLVTPFLRHLEVGDLVRPEVAVAFLELFQDAGESHEVAKAAHKCIFVHGRLPKEWLLRAFEVFAHAGSWDSGVLSQALGLVSETGFDCSSNDGERFITALAKVRCTQPTLLEKLVEEYVTPRVQESKAISYDLLLALAKLNVNNAAGIFQDIADEVVSVELQTGTQLTPDVALRILSASQVFDIYPKKYVEIFLGSLHVNMAGWWSAYGADVVSDATTLLLGLEQQGLVPLSKSEVDKFLSSLRDSFEAEHQEHQDKIPSLLSPHESAVDRYRGALLSVVKDTTCINQTSSPSKRDKFVAALLCNKETMQFVPCSHISPLVPGSSLEGEKDEKNLQYVAIIAEQSRHVAENTNHPLGAQVLYHKRMRLLGWSVLWVTKYQLLHDRREKQIIRQLLMKFMLECHRRPLQTSMQVVNYTRVPLNPITSKETRDELERQHLFPALYKYTSGSVVSQVVNRG